jgi:hypothetical protein
MSVGDRLAGYLAGLEVGYFLRVGEENERWRRSIGRFDVAEPERVMIIDKVRIVRWTWREREADRLATLQEAHAAGLHDERPATAAGCRGCAG